MEAEEIKQVKEAASKLTSDLIMLSMRSSDSTVSEDAQNFSDAAFNLSMALRNLHETILISNSTVVDEE